jgi:hypothetical protein
VVFEGHHRFESYTIRKADDEALRLNSRTRLERFSFAHHNMNGRCPGGEDAALKAVAVNAVAGSNPVPSVP